MGVKAEGTPRVCHREWKKTPASLGYPPSVFNKNSTLKLSSQHHQHHRVTTAMLLQTSRPDVASWFKKRGQSSHSLLCTLAPAFPESLSLSYPEIAQCSLQSCRRRLLWRRVLRPAFPSCFDLHFTFRVFKTQESHKNVIVYSETIFFAHIITDDLNSFHGTFEWGSSWWHCIVWGLYVGSQ